MPEFLVLSSPQEALSKWFAEFPILNPKSEQIDSAFGLNRITSEPIRSVKPIPEFMRSTVDGYAVRSKDTFGASESMPVYLDLAGEVPMGKSPDFLVEMGKAALIHTGGMLPTGADAVVMLENTQKTNQGVLEVVRAVALSENVIQIGEDIAADQIVIPAGTRLRAAEIGGLMALGHVKVKVNCKPLVGILSSGDEVVEPQAEPVMGQVRDINSYSLAAHIEEWGGEPLRLGIIPDRLEALRTALASALERCDALLVTAGSSVSVRDLTSQVIGEMGKPGVLVHGLNIKPGKPTILAVCNGKAIVGMPGNPVSALVIARFFVKPLVERLLGFTSLPVEPSISATLTLNLSSQSGREDWWPVRLVQTPEGMTAVPIFFKSNLIFTYSQADGLIKIPAEATGLTSGTRVEVFSL